MAQPRTRSTTTTSSSGLNLGHTQHVLSLKVLRLSRPSLAVQTALPPTTFGNGLDVPARASLAYPQSNINKSGSSADAGTDTAPSTFPLTPLLTLPPAFGAAYVGEEFTCTLCANNDVPDDADDETKGRRIVRDVRMGAEMLVPGREKGVPVELYGVEGEAEAAGETRDHDHEGEFPPGATLQRTLRYELKEEGPHQLAVTVTYKESSTAASPSLASTEKGGRAADDEFRTRTFKKLYQFVAQPLIAVRSKVTERRRRRSDDTRREEERQWVLEAQLENVGEVSVVVERVREGLREGIASCSVNNDQVAHEGKDDDGGREGHGEGFAKTTSSVVLKPQDVEQVMFVLTELPGVRKVPEEEDDEEGVVGVGRIALAQVNVDWRAAMGEKGSLTTGWLGTRRL